MPIAVGANPRWSWRAAFIPSPFATTTVSVCRISMSGGREAITPPIKFRRLLLVPQLITGEEAQHRIRVQSLASILPLTWSVLLVGLIAAQIIRRSIFEQGFDRQIAVGIIPIFVAALTLFVIGISWGIPDYHGWAADEITPDDMHDILEHRFSHGWATIYPPLHFGVLSLASVPIYIANRVGLVDDTLETYSQLFFAGRIVSVAMALCHSRVRLSPDAGRVRTSLGAIRGDRDAARVAADLLFEDRES